MQSEDSPDSASADLSILSARLHDDSAAIRAAAEAISRSRPTTYGAGWLIRDEGDLPDAPLEVNRSLPQLEPQSKKKQRGRPRIETQDETETDRRRTRYRINQRNYREKRRSSLSRLENREKILRNAVESMHELFLQYRNTSDGADRDRIAEQLDLVYNASKDRGRQSGRELEYFEDYRKFFRGSSNESQIDDSMAQ